MKKIVTALLLLAVAFTTFTANAGQTKTKSSPQTWIAFGGGYYDLAKKDFVIPPNRFNNTYDFAANGLALVILNGKYGYINQKGELVIPARFDNAWDFAANGLAAVSLNGKWGYINQKGELVIPARFDNAFTFAANGLAAVILNGKWGYINQKGELVIPARFDDAGNFAANGLALVSLNGKYGYINQKGYIVLMEDYMCDTQVFKDVAGRIIWPKDIKRICNLKAKTKNTANLDAKTIKNFTYRTLDSGIVTLKNGKCEIDYPGVATHGEVEIITYAIGNSSITNQPVAIVILLDNTGGNHPPSEITALIKERDEIIQTNTIGFGQGVIIRKLIFQKGYDNKDEILVSMFGYRPTDPLCCPSLPEIKYFNLVYDKNLHKIKLVYERTAVLPTAK